MGRVSGQFWVANDKVAAPLSFRVSPETLLIENQPVALNGEDLSLPSNPLPDPDETIRNRLIAIGEGIDWPLWEQASSDRLRPLLDFAASTPVFTRGIGQSSVIPEAALLVANRIGCHIGDDAKILVRPDLDLVALQMAFEGREVTYWEQGEHQGDAMSGYEHVQVLQRDLAAPVPPHMVNHFDVAFVDLLPPGGFILGEASRLTSCVKPGGIIAILAHPKQRYAAKTLLGSLPVELIDTCLELVPRYGVGYSRQDEFWDLWILRRQTGGFLYAPQKALPKSGGDRTDLEEMLVWASEIHGLMSQIQPATHIEPAIQWLASNGVIQPLEIIQQSSETHAHYFVPLPEGKFINITANLQEQFITIAIRGWTPLLQMQIGSALFLFAPPQDTFLRRTVG